MSSTPFRTRKKSSVSSCLCQTNSPFTFTTMTSQLLNWLTTRGDQYSENLANFSDKSMLSLMGPSDVVAYELTRQYRWPAISRRWSIFVVGPFLTLGDVRLESGIRTQADARQRLRIYGFKPWLVRWCCGAGYAPAAGTTAV